MEFRVLLLIALIQIACSNAMRKKKGSAAEKGANIRQADEESELEKPSIGEDSTLNRVDADNFDLDNIIKARIAEAISGLSSKVSSVSTRVSTLEKNKHFCQSAEKDILVAGGNKGKGIGGELNLVIQYPRAFKNTPAVAYAVVKALTSGNNAKPISFDADMRATSKTSFTVGLQNYGTTAGYFLIRWMACGV